MAQDPYGYLNASSQQQPDYMTQVPQFGANQIGTATTKDLASVGSGMDYSTNMGMNTNMGMSNPYGGYGTTYNTTGTRGGIEYPGRGQGGTVDPNMRDPQQQTPVGSFPWGSQSNVNNPYANYQNMFDPAYWANDTQATQGQRYLDNTLPWAQYQQNQYQYAQDYNEAQRRWNLEMQRQQGLDQFQQNFSNQQLDFSRWQADVANSQWGEQFRQQQANDRFSQGLANQQFGLQQQTQNWNQNIQQQQQNLANRQADIEAQYRSGLIDVQTAQNEIAKLNYQNQYALGTRNADITQQNYANQYQLGQGRLTLDQTLGMGNLDIARQKLMQEAQQAAANRELQLKLASIQAGGRAQAVPTARFVANW